MSELTATEIKILEFIKSQDYFCLGSDKEEYKEMRYRDGKFFYRYRSAWVNEIQEDYEISPKSVLINTRSYINYRMWEVDKPDDKTDEEILEYILR